MKLLILTDIRVGHQKDVADAAYYPLSENNDGTKILKEDVENFITNVEVMTVGEKTTIVNAHTLTGFDTVRHSSCVDPKNYSKELGKQYAMEEVVNSLWDILDLFFNGLNMVLMLNLKKMNNHAENKRFIIY